MSEETGIPPDHLVSFAPPFYTRKNAHVYVLPSRAFALPTMTHRCASNISRPSAMLFVLSSAKAKSSIDETLSWRSSTSRQKSTAQFQCALKHRVLV